VYGGTGTTYASWIGANTGYVTKWYDQGSSANHGTQTTTASQPSIAIVGGKYVIYNVGTSNQFINITTPIQPNTIFSEFYILTDNGYNSIITTQFDYQMRFPSSTFNVGNNDGDWYFSGTGTKINSVNNLTNQTSINGAGVWNKFSVSVSSPAWTTGQTSGVASQFNRVGMDGYNQSRALSGYFTSMICHNTTMSASSMMSYYANSLF
jgi:hypothetical protein